VLAPAVLALLLATTVSACGGGDEETATQPAPTRARAMGASVVELVRLSGTIGHPIYWAGPFGGNTYELSRTKDGRVYVRYLPKGTRIGDPKPAYLTVGTYPQAQAFATLKANAKKQGVPTIALRGGGLAFADKNRPTSVYVAYPGSAYQIEVYHPSADRARALVESGRIVPVGIATAGRATATAVTPEEIEAAATRARHPIFWAGQQTNSTYELTRTSDGRIYVRYLPAGVEVGDARPSFLTVGTYPQADALAALKASAEKDGSETIDLDGGGLAVIAEKPTSAYLAYPRQPLLVEVYDPDAARVRELVTSGRIAPVG
jgi:hypothetical protein